jgi:hypothetical protein
VQFFWLNFEQFLAFVRSSVAIPAGDMNEMESWLRLVLGFSLESQDINFLQMACALLPCTS